MSRRTQIGFLSASIICLCIASPLTAQTTIGDLPMDQTATDAILAATTSRDFLTEWIDVLPEHPTVPSPRDVIGYTIGTPGELTQVEDIYAYFTALAEASDRGGSVFSRPKF